ncbi:MAG: hypothetical protein JWQ49_2383 [Edaphobacter sp.]|nr:hypothetical protein [Edaphobacter sp.]
MLLGSALRGGVTGVCSTCVSVSRFGMNAKSPRSVSSPELGTRRTSKALSDGIEGIERLEVEVPVERGFSLSDVTIGGVPIRYGGQIAECITVKLTGVAVLANVNPVPLPCDAHAVIDPAYPLGLSRPVAIGGPIPAGTVIALVNQGEGAVVPPAPKVATKAALSEAADVAEVLTLRRRI